MTSAKAITAFLTGVVGVAAMFIPGITDIVTPEVIAAVTVLAQTALVWFVPNRPA
jgi:hypothetical protein